MLTDYVLSWSDNSTNAAGFWIECSTYGSTWTSAGIVGPHVTSSSIPWPPYDQTVFWRLIAFKGQGSRNLPKPPKLTCSHQRFDCKIKQISRIRIGLRLSGYLFGLGFLFDWTNQDVELTAQLDVRLGNFELDGLNKDWAI